MNSGDGYIDGKKKEERILHYLETIWKYKEFESQRDCRRH